MGGGAGKGSNTFAAADCRRMCRVAAVLMGFPVVTVGAPVDDVMPATVNGTNGGNGASSSDDPDL